MSTQPEIKAGQRWFRIILGGRGDMATVEHVTETDVFYVVSQKGERLFPNGETKTEFIKNYKLIPEPTTRPITADDIMKMLAVNPVIYYSALKEPQIWFLLTRPDDWAKGTPSAFRFSHNPFAPMRKLSGLW